MRDAEECKRKSSKKIGARANLAVPAPRRIELDEPNAIRVHDLGVEVFVGERDDV